MKRSPGMLNVRFGHLHHLSNGAFIQRAQRDMGDCQISERNVRRLALGYMEMHL